MSMTEISAIDIITERPVTAIATKHRSSIAITGAAVTSEPCEFERFPRR